ncbi:MAG: lasso peptide biosynthesis B2 protein [Acidimicrobiales bacterium]
MRRLRSRRWWRSLPSRGRRLATVARLGLRRLRGGGLGGIGNVIVVAGLWAAAEASVRVVPLPRLSRAFGAELAPGSTPRAPDALSGDRRVTEPAALTATEQDRVRLAEVFGRQLASGPGPCLRQALVTARVLRRLEPRLHLGVARRQSGEVWAHAWVELEDGRAFGRDDAVVPF